MKTSSYALGILGPVRLLNLSGSLIFLMTLSVTPASSDAATATLTTTKNKYTLNRIRPNHITSGGNKGQQSVDLGDVSGQVLNHSWVTAITPSDPGVTTDFSRTKNYIWKIQFPNNNANGWIDPADPVLGPLGDYYVIYSIDGKPGKLSSIKAAFPTAEANVVMETYNLRIRRRNNGRLRDIRGGIRFNLGMDSSTNANGRYRGNIRIEVTSPNGSITIN